jgi:hypothetical protein
MEYHESRDVLGPMCLELRALSNRLLRQQPDIINLLELSWGERDLKGVIDSASLELLYETIA